MVRSCYFGKKKRYERRGKKIIVITNTYISRSARNTKYGVDTTPPYTCMFFKFTVFRIGLASYDARTSYRILNSRVDFPGCWSMEVPVNRYRYDRGNIKIPSAFSPEHLGYLRLPTLSSKRIWQAYKKVKWFSFLKLSSPGIEIQSESK